MIVEGHSTLGSTHTSTMFAIRCTRKLLTRGGPELIRAAVPPTTVLGDWYANIVVSRPEHIVICISEKTLLPVIVTAKIMDKLAIRVAVATAKMLEAVGVPSQDIEEELRQMDNAYLTNTLNRSILGTLNDFVYHFKHGTASVTELTLHERALRLAEMPCGALKYAFPSEYTLGAFAARRVMNAAKSAA